MADPGPDLEKQIAYYRRKHDRNPQSRVFAPLADLYRHSGEHQQALELIEAGLRLHPRYVSALVIQGHIYTEMGAQQQARASYQRVLELDPDNLVVLKLLAEDAARDGDLTRAIGLLERVVVLDPSDQPAESRLDALRSQYQLSAPQESGTASAPGEGAADHPETRHAPPIETSAGSDESQRSADGRSRVAGEEATPADEPQAVVTKTLADIYLAQGYRDRALEVLRQILARHPERQDVRDRLADIEGGSLADQQAEVDPGAETAPGDAGDAERNEGDLDRAQFESWLQRADGKAKE